MGWFHQKPAHSHSVEHRSTCKVMQFDYHGLLLKGQFYSAWFLYALHFYNSVGVCECVCTFTYNTILYLHEGSHYDLIFFLGISLQSALSKIYLYIYIYIYRNYYCI